MADMITPSDLCGDSARRLRAISRLCIATMVLGAAAVASETSSCGTTGISVDAPDPAVAGSVCRAIEQALPLFSACHLDPPGDLMVRVTEDLEGVPDRCVGFYECETNEIWLRSPNAIRRSRALSEGFSEIDPRVFFESLVVHELSHAAFEHSATPAARLADNHEYVGYVMQMWALPEDVRQSLVDRYPANDPADPSFLNVFIAALSPERYAAIAWQHFMDEGNGCDFIGDLTTGAATLHKIIE